MGLTTLEILNVRLPGVQAIVRCKLVGSNINGTLNDSTGTDGWNKIGVILIMSIDPNKVEELEESF